MTFVLLVKTPQGHAQSFFGSLIGTVTDSTGAALPGSSVVITNLATAEKRVEKTDGSGYYRISNLVPGRYREEVEAAGFKHYTREPIAVEVDSSVRIDVPMELGGATETVTVTTESPLLESDSASLGQVIEPKTVQELPINGRNVLSLIALAPGVVPQTGNTGAAAGNSPTGFTNVSGWNSVQVGGGLAGQAASFYDGAPANGLGANVIQLIMTQDAVDEFRVETNSPSAEYGRFGGGVINYTTKSGGAQLHGAVYEYFRNKVLNASTYFSKASAQPKPGYNQNQFGGTTAGPLRRDKLFYFGSYEQFKIVIGTSVLTLVPTAAERAGDFSADPIIYDPLTTTLAGGVYTRQPFANNKIPSTRFDTTANVIANVLQYFPLPNTAQAGGNYAATRNPSTTDRQGTARIDGNLSQKQHMFGRFTYWELHDVALNPFNNKTASAAGDQVTYAGVLGDTYSLSSKTTLDLRLSVLRGFTDNHNQDLGQDLSVFGPSWATLNYQVTTRDLPSPIITGLYSFSGAAYTSHNYRDVAAIAPSISSILGKHSLKAGADLRLSDDNYVFLTNASGSFTFDKSFTSANASASGTTGVAFASFLLGYPASGSLTTAHPAGQFNRYQAYFVNDTWQTARNLTVNLGVRWELPGGWMERHDLASNFQPNAPSPLGGNYHGNLELVNSPAWSSRTTENLHYDLFAPRLGVSYNPTKTTVLGAGYGIAYLPFDLFQGAMPFLSPINSAVNTMATSVNNAGVVPFNTLSNPFPAGNIPGTVQQSLLQPAGRSQTYLNNLIGLNVSDPVPATRYPYDQQWNLRVQQQLLASGVLTIAYAGTRGTFLPLGTNTAVGSVNNLNQLPDQYDSMGAALLTPVANPLAGLVNNAGTLNGATVSAGQLLRPYPQYSSLLRSNAQGDNIYHSLQVSYQQRFKNGGVLSSNYTWAKSIGNVAGNVVNGDNGTVGVLQDFTTPRGDRSLSNYDVRSRYVTSFVSPLPFGHGQRYLADLSHVASGFVSGWEADTIITFQTGLPVSIYAQANTLSNSFGAGTIRPNIVPGCVKPVQGKNVVKVAHWFNTACFTAPSSYSFGNEPRVDGAIRASGIANYDLSLEKSTGLTKRLNLQLRGEIFNIFNRVQFQYPATQLGTSTFGTVAATANQPRQIQLSARIEF